jgi:hypothetical protein
MCNKSFHPSLVENSNLSIQLSVQACKAIRCNKPATIPGVHSDPTRVTVLRSMSFFSMSLVILVTALREVNELGDHL